MLNVMANCNQGNRLSQFSNNYKKKIYTHTQAQGYVCVYLPCAYYELNLNKDLLTSKHEEQNEGEAISEKKMTEIFKN